MTLRPAFTGIVALLSLLSHAGSEATAQDWPMWRADAGRTGATELELPDSLSLRWTRQLPTPRPAWPASQGKLQYDLSYEPIIVGQHVIVGSMVNDSVTAYSTANGEERWRFFTGGPVRFAPASDGAKVFVVSDDGYLYALAADSGRLLWKVNGGPAERPILGQDRLISSWPARGAPVVTGGVVYFTASIWPSMGIFVHAISAESGDRLWTNSELGEQFMVHPHGASSFGSIAPQGYLAVAGDYLVIPGGRTPPAILDRRTGKLVQFAFRGKGEGDYGTMAIGDSFILKNQRLTLDDGQSLGTIYPGIFANGFFIGEGSSDRINAISLAGKMKEESTVDRKGVKYTKKSFSPAQAWELKVDGPANVRLAAGKTLVAANQHQIATYDFSQAKTSKSSAEQKPLWSTEIDGEIWSLLAGDGKLLVVTTSGQLLCFDKASSSPPQRHELSSPGKEPASSQASANLTEPLSKLVSHANAQAGFAIVVGAEQTSTITELIRSTDLHVIAIDESAERVERFRRQMTEAGWYGTRVSACVGDARTYPFPPYMSQLTLVQAGETIDPALITSLYRSLRPYGGTLACQAEGDSIPALSTLVNAEGSNVSGYTLITRAGSLPGAAPWTHQYADAGNSVVSQDTLVKAPLGVLWFGGPSNDKILPRHGHGPSPQVAGGRLVIEGPDMLRAVDVYTGRLLWERDLPGVGKYYDNTSHAPGAGEIGSNYVTTPDRVYVVHGPDLLELNAATGETVRTFREQDDQGQPATWGYLAISGDLLITTSSPVKLDDKDVKTKSPSVDQFLSATQYASASKRLLAFDRTTGKRLWDRVARFSFRHNGIAVAAGKVFAIDGMSPAQLATLKRRGIESQGEARLLALDGRTGREVWTTSENVFGTFLNYSAEHDVLVQAGSAYRDRAKDEVGEGIVAYRGSSGDVVWKNLDLKYGGPCLLWKDKIITNGGGGFQLELLTGKLTGWSYNRMYGCNTAIGSQNLLTFRSGAAGYFDLAANSGTGNIGGFRSSCTANLIPADGVLNAPDYTRTCTCSYQNQVSLALIHMPEAETWTFQPEKVQEQLADRVGINLGAPGDRRDDSGTLWLEYPMVGGPSPKVEVKVEATEAAGEVKWFRQHSSLVSAAGLDWVAASGGEGIRSVLISLDNRERRTYTVRLHFSEPQAAAEGERRFSIALQGEKVVPELDIMAEAGESNRGIVKEFTGIAIERDLRIELNASGKVPSKLQPILCGVEIMVEAPQRPSAAPSR